MGNDTAYQILQNQSLADELRIKNDEINSISLDNTFLEQQIEYVQDQVKKDQRSKTTQDPKMDIKLQNKIDEQINVLSQQKKKVNSLEKDLEETQNEKENLIIKLEKEKKFFEDLSENCSHQDLYQLIKKLRTENDNLQEKVEEVRVHALSSSPTSLNIEQSNLLKEQWIEIKQLRKMVLGKADGNDSIKFIDELKKTQQEDVKSNYNTLRRINAEYDFINVLVRKKDFWNYPIRNQEYLKEEKIIQSQFSAQVCNHDRCYMVNHFNFNPNYKIQIDQNQTSNVGMNCPKSLFQEQQEFRKTSINNEIKNNNNTNIKMDQNSDQKVKIENNTNLNSENNNEDTKSNNNSEIKADPDNKPDPYDKADV